MKSRKISIRYKINYNKIIRNILILFILCLIVLYFILINNRTLKNIESVKAFSEYAKSNGIQLTEDNYKNFIK